MIPYLCTSLRMNDKECLPDIIMEHGAIFDEKALESVTTDKGYYSQVNIKFVEAMTGNADGVQRPVNVKNQVEAPRKEELFNRRAGVEPLIGHAKQFGLKKKQNEIRRGNALVRIPICHGIQSPSINKVPRVKRVAPDGLGDSTK